MESTMFDGKYLAISGCDADQYEVAVCDSEQEVYKFLSERIRHEIEYTTDDGTVLDDWIDDYWTNIACDYVKRMLHTDKVLQSWEDINECYDLFFSSSWWYVVLDCYGDVIHEYKC